MLDRQIKNQEITYVFSLLSTNITFNSQQSMLDINKTMETVLNGLLNIIYKANFINLNLIKHNHPAVDLGDAQQNWAIQITSDGTKSKMEKTIEMLENHKLNDKYSKIWFLIISNDQKVTYTKKNYTIDICNLSDIANKINSLDNYDFEEVYTYCESNFSIYFPRNNSAILAPTQKITSNPSSTITKFLVSNGFDSKDEGVIFESESVRNSIINLKNILNDLNDDQKWFLYRVIEWSIMRYEQEYPMDQCYIPMSTISQQAGDTRNLKSIADSLINYELASYDEEVPYVSEPGFYIFYTNSSVEEFCLFTGIANFVRVSAQGNSRKDLLKSIIVDVEFSKID